MDTSEGQTGVLAAHGDGAGSVTIDGGRAEGGIITAKGKNGGPITGGTAVRYCGGVCLGWNAPKVSFSGKTNYLTLGQWDGNDAGKALKIGPVRGVGVAIGKTDVRLWKPLVTSI